jgi:methyl-accepting chemotaxis protein
MGFAVRHSDQVALGTRAPVEPGWRSWLGLQKEAAPAAPPAIMAPDTTNEDRLVEAIDRLIRSQFVSAGALDGRLGDTVQRMTRFVREANDACLRAVATLTHQACEATINIGWAYNDSREVANTTTSISSAVEEMAASISELSNSSDISASQAENARDTMRSCISDSRSATVAMESIQERSSSIEQRLTALQTAVDQIREMTGSIESIARQTNLLALNATIEAARAGELGRGFAVVASEVKALSIQTGNATKDIQARVSTLAEGMSGIRSAVKDSLKSVSEGSAVVKQVGAIIEGVGDEVSEVAMRIRGISDLLEQQRAATSEIASNTQRIAEKANKTKDEFEAIGRRLEDCEAIATKAFDAAAKGPSDRLGLIRFAADAAAWKRLLCSILLVKVPTPETAPQLDAAQAVAEAETLCASGGADRTLYSDFTNAIEEARKNATVVVTEVRRSNWGGATPAYIACDEALKTAALAADKLSRAVSGDSGP